MGVPEGLFDSPLQTDQAKDFLNDPLHDMVLALCGDEVIGMASGQVMLHPDKTPAFFINEVGVRDTFLRKGIGTQLCLALKAVAEARGCDVIWLVTDSDNTAARALYRSLDAREITGVVVYDWDGPNVGQKR